MHTLQTISEAIESWIGSKMDLKIQFKHLRVDGGPTELWIGVFFPTGPTSGSDMTWLFTVGLAQGVAPGEHRAAELVFIVKGSLERDVIDDAARQLAELAVRPYLEGTFFELGRVFRGLTIRPFARMNNLLITSWEPQGTSLPDLTNPDVDLLWVVPLFDSEVEGASLAGGRSLISAIRVEDLQPEDPSRPSDY